MVPQAVSPADPVGFPPRGKTRAWVAVAPLVLMLAIGLCGPNFRFRSGEEVREFPPGGDLAQEYAAGKMWRDPALRPRIYDLQAFREAQHNPEWMGEAWRQEKYFPPVYPPYWYALTSPLAAFPLPVAAWCWLGLMSLCLSAALVTIHRTFSAPAAWMVAACVCSPVLLSLSTGQKGTLLLLILAGSLALLVRGRRFASGAVFALIAFKPHLGLAIGLGMLAGRQWRWLAGCLTAVLAVLLATWIFEAALLRDFISASLELGNYVQTGGYVLADSYSLWSAIQLLVRDPDAAKIITALGTLVVLGVTVWHVGESMRREDEEPVRSWAALTLLTVVVSPHLYGYDLVMLVLPGGIIAGLVRQGTARRGDLVCGGILLVVLFGRNLLVAFAEGTGIPAGPILLLAALGVIVGETAAGRSRLHSVRLGFRHSPSPGTPDPGH